MEGLLTENQSSGSKKKIEELCEMMKKKHGKEFADLLQEYEEGKQKDLGSENEASEEVEGKDQELKVKVEEILTLMKEMNRGQKEKYEVEVRNCETQRSNGEEHDDRNRKKQKE